MSLRAVGPRASVNDFMLAIGMVARAVTAAAPNERHQTAAAAWDLLRRGLAG